MQRLRIFFGLEQVHVVAFQDFQPHGVAFLHVVGDVSLLRPLLELFLKDVEGLFHRQVKDGQKFRQRGFKEIMLVQHLVEALLVKTRQSQRRNLQILAKLFFIDFRQRPKDFLIQVVEVVRFRALADSGGLFHQMVLDLHGRLKAGSGHLQKNLRQRVHCIGGGRCRFRLVHHSGKGFEQIQAGFKLPCEPVLHVCLRFQRRVRIGRNGFGHVQPHIRGGLQPRENGRFVEREGVACVSHDDLFSEPCS